MCASCGCNSDNTTSQDIQLTRPAIDPASYTVTGMTCGHCVASVTEEVSAIDGVHDVVVDLATGNLTFASERPVARDEVDAAIREAGYTLA